MTGNSDTLYTIVRAERGDADDIPVVCNSIAFTLVNGKMNTALASAEPVSMHARGQVHQCTAGKVYGRHPPIASA